MPIRLIDPDAVIELDCKGTVFKIKQMDQGQQKLFTRSRVLAFARDDMEAFAKAKDIFAKHVVECKQFEGMDIRECLDKIPYLDLVSLMVDYENKTCISPDMEKNSASSHKEGS